jgi:CDP-2,3-bis-(O-geranylgeranyl)-sn-glycerol synthase
MDFGRKARDGRPLLGPGKTWRGLAGGVLGGLFIGGIQITASAAYGDPSILPSFAPTGGPAEPASFLVVFTLALGAMMGDAAKSFAKRRLGLDRGRKLPFADQYDFVVGAWLLTFLLFPAWFASMFSIEVIVSVVLVTFAMHRAVSQIGYRMGLKAEPW